MDLEKKMDTDVYTNIKTLYEHLKTDPNFINIVPSQGFTLVKISFCPDVKAIEFLLKELAYSISNGKKKTITNRKTNYVVFEWGLGILEKELFEIAKLKSLCDEIGMYTGVYKHADLLSIDILSGFKENDISIMPTIQQGLLVNKLRENFGFKTNGTIGLLCLVYAFNSAEKCGLYKHITDNEFFSSSSESVKFKLAAYYYNDNGLLEVVRKQFKTYENKLLEYVRDMYVYIKEKELDNKNKTDVASRLILIDKIEKSGYLNI